MDSHTRSTPTPSKQQQKTPRQLLQTRPNPTLHPTRRRVKSKYPPQRPLRTDRSFAVATEQGLSYRHTRFSPIMVPHAPDPPSISTTTNDPSRLKTHTPHSLSHTHTTQASTTLKPPPHHTTPVTPLRHHAPYILDRPQQRTIQTLSLIHI